MAKLTAVQIRSAKPKNKPYKLSDGHGLYFHVAKSGLMTWRYRFRVAGKESTFTLGEYPEMNLGDARIARTEARKLVREGKNPSDLRRQERQHEIDKQLADDAAKENIFKNIALEWIEQQSGRWSKDHADAVLNTLQFDAFPEIGANPVDTVTPPMVLNIIRKIEDRGSLEMARKVLQRMNAVFRYAVQTGKACVGHQSRTSSEHPQNWSAEGLQTLLLIMQKQR